MAKKRLSTNVRWTLKKHRDLTAYAQNILGYMLDNASTSGFHGVSHVGIMDATSVPLEEVGNALKDLEIGCWISIGNDEIYLVHGTYKKSANSIVTLNDGSNSKSKGKFTNSAHDAVWSDILDYIVFFDEKVILYEFREFFEVVKGSALLEDYKHKLTPPTTPPITLPHNNSSSDSSNSFNSSSDSSNSFNNVNGSYYNSFDEDASAVAMIENTREKTIYENRGKPCDNCNAKNGEQCQKEVIYNSKCLSSSVRTEV